MTLDQLKKAAHLKAEIVAEIADKHGIPADVALQIVNQEAVGQSMDRTETPANYGL